MTDIFGDTPAELSQAHVRTVSVGDDLYSASVSELTDRIGLLENEIIRTKAALTKKRQELSEAETLFGKSPSLNVNIK